MAVQHAHSPQTRRNMRRTIMVCLMVIVAVLVLLVHKMLTPKVLSAEQLRQNGAVVLDPPRNFNDFTLVDDTGQPFTKTNFKGHWTLLYFGYTHCPDVCPTTMAKLDRFTRALKGKMAQNTQVVLVSLDPARDTPKVLHQYVQYFNPAFSGVTGKFLTIRRFANQVNVAFNKVTQGDDYSIDHSANLVLIDPAGRYRGFFKPPFTLAKMQLTFSAIYHQYQ